MNDFDGLLPPPAAPPPLPSRGGPAVVVERARRRKARNAAKAVTTSGLLSIALLAFNAITPPATTKGVEVDPTATPRPAASAPVAPSRAPGTGPSSRPAFSLPGSDASATPGAGDRSSPPAGAGAPIAGPVTPTLAPSEVPRPQLTRIDREFVVDPAPGENCYMETWTTSPGAVICSRTYAPPTVRSGQPASFVYEACAAGTDQNIHFIGEAEIDLYLFLEADGSQAWATERPNGPTHDMVIPAGQCARYTVHWPGRGHDGKPLQPASYVAGARLVDNGGIRDISKDTFEVV